MKQYDVQVTKITDITELHEANEFTSGYKSTLGFATAYHQGHSTIRTQLFKIKIYEMKTKTSVHLVRHSVTGQLHFVKTHRKDLTQNHDHEITRCSPVNHLLYLNAQHLIDMGRKRLCNRSEYETVEIMKAIRSAVKEVDPALATRMVPECIYRGGWCYEGKNCCGYMPKAPLDVYKLIELRIT